MEMAQKKHIFRKASLQRLSSPEQLDQLMKVTHPRGWIALTALGGLLATAILWSILGSIPTKVQGQGILIKSGGVFEVVSVGSGQVTDVAIEVGDEVTEGQVIARIAQPQLLEDIQQAKADLRELRTQYAEVKRFGRQDLELQTAYLTQQRTSLEQNIEIARERLRWLDEKIENQEQLLDQGLITRQTLLNTRQAYYQTQDEIEDSRNQLKQIASRELTYTSQREQELLDWQFKINEAERSIAQMEEEYDLLSEVVSQYTGRVLEIMVEPGNLIREGMPVIRLDLVGRSIKNLEAVLYVSSVDGKRVKPGMRVQIAPTTVKQEEYGFMLGDVTYVSDFPATTQGMMRVLKNEQLVQTLSGGGAPFEVYADLRIDPATQSGFKWSSSDGPPMDIQTGTVCRASVTVDERRPIELVLPILREWTGV